MNKKIKLTLYRIFTNDEGTKGELKYENFLICNILELPDRENKRKLSRIPAGEYICKYMSKTWSGKYKKVYQVQNVPKRSGILFHVGNYAGDVLKGFKTHSLGCLLPCSNFGSLKGQDAGLASEKAMDKLRTLVGKNSFILEVKNEK